jgi:RsiW-degrading membrane proteinase PrsW (M82 family)
MTNESISLSSTALALIGGFVPAFVWLWFWLKEDDAPEPLRLILTAFIGGMLAIPVALVLEKAFLQELLPSIKSACSTEMLVASGILLMGSAFIEECAKLLAALVFIFWRKEYDEPADAMIYLITAALGFAAVENVIYLQQMSAWELAQGLTVINLRFIGATLLHALSSALLGYFIGGAFFRGKVRKEIAIILGLFAATLLHTLFNLSILVAGTAKGVGIEPALSVLIAAGILILFSFDRIKRTIQ